MTVVVLNEKIEDEFKPKMLKTSFIAAAVPDEDEEKLTHVTLTRKGVDELGMDDDYLIVKESVEQVAELINAALQRTCTGNKPAPKVIP